MKTIVVLMSTYNGKRYLRQQLDSILQQDCFETGQVVGRILIRDDHSQDGTQEILEEYKNQYKESIDWYQGENIGVIASFFDLLQHAPASDFYAFSDQDDFWMPHKLARAIECLSPKQQEPSLYSCATQLVDENLKPISSTIDRSLVRPSFKNALIENVATGCTEVFNALFYELLVKELPAYTPMHDWWLYLVGTAFGTYIYDKEPYISYRQHSGNVLGTKTNHLAEFQIRIKRFRKNRGNISRQAAEFVRIFSHRFPDNENILTARELVSVKTSFGKRWHFLKKAGLYRQRKMDNYIFAWIMRMGNY